MIPETKIRKLVRAVMLGRIKGRASHRVLGVSSATFTRWVREAERLGVKFHKNPRGGHRYGEKATPATAWRVKVYGPFKGV